MHRAISSVIALLGSIVLSLGAAIVATNNYGGIAVGFRHAVYLSPALVTLLLPWVVAGGRSGRAVLAVAAVSTALMLIFPVRQPWSALSWSEARTIVKEQMSWDQYVPLIAKIVRGDLFKRD